jgi:hypothetical protein
MNQYNINENINPSYKTESTSPSSNTYRDKYLKYDQTEGLHPKLDIWQAKYLKYKAKYIASKEQNAGGNIGEGVIFTNTDGLDNLAMALKVKIITEDNPNIKEAPSTSNLNKLLNKKGYLIMLGDEYAQLTDAAKISTLVNQYFGHGKETKPPQTKIKLDKRFGYDEDAYKKLSKTDLIKFKATPTSSIRKQGNQFNNIITDEKIKEDIESLKSKISEYKHIIKIDFSALKNTYLDDVVINRAKEIICK